MPLLDRTNEAGEIDTADPTALGGGSIVIHK